MTGDEFGEYADIKELRNKAKEFYRQHLRGTSVRNPILGEVELTDDVIMFTNIGLNKMGSSSAQKQKILLVKHLPKLIEKADKVTAEGNLKDKRNASQYSYLHSTAEIDGKIENVNITIFTDANGNRYYNHNIGKFSKNEKDLPVHSAQATKNDDGIPTIGKPSLSNITQAENNDKENSDIQRNPLGKGNSLAENTETENKLKNQSETDGYKYYLRERPYSIGTLPNDVIRIDETDTGDKVGRYGAAYFSRELSKNEIENYGLIPDIEEEILSDAEVDEASRSPNVAKVVKKYGGEINNGHVKFSDKDKEKQFKEQLQRYLEKKVNIQQNLLAEEKPAGENNSEIEEDVREILKKAKLENKTLPEKFSKFVAPPYFGNNVVQVGENFNHNMTIKDESYGSEYKPSVRDEYFFHPLERLAIALSGKRKGRDSSGHLPHFRYWGYELKDNESAEKFIKAVKVYFGIKEQTAEEINKKAHEALKVAGLEKKTVSADLRFQDTGKTAFLLAYDYDAPYDKRMKEERPDIVKDLKKLIGRKGQPLNGFVFEQNTNWNMIAEIVLLKEEDVSTAKRAIEIYLRKEEKYSERVESNKSGGTVGGHQVRESAVRELFTEETRQTGNDEISERSIGRERQTGREIEENVTGTNAGSKRPVSIQNTGTASARNGAGNGTGRTQTTLQSDDRAEFEDRAERGDRRVNENVENVEYAGHNFKISADTEIGRGGEKAKFKQNLDAVKLLKKLEREGRKATPSEQEILAKFNGWGTLASAFTNNDEWSKENQELKEILTEEEYKSASVAMTNAFYTHPKIAEAMWEGLKQLGFKGGRILNSSMGSGIFFGTMPSEIAVKSELTGVEKDNLTGGIAKQLYQKATVDVMGFEERKLPNNYFDLAISNVPFSGQVRIYSDPDYKKQGYKLHNFFFAKAVDKVRPGGIVAFITSTGTMQSTSLEAEKLRAELNGKADLIAAFKLPSNTFEKNAGTQVTTDILILQKRLDPKKPSEYAQDWDKIEVIDVEDKIDNKWDYTYRLPINEYFQNHPENMIGKPKVDTLYRVEDGRNRLALDGTDRDVAKELSYLMNKLPKDIFVPIQNKTQDTLKNTFVAMANSSQYENSYSIHDGKIVQKIDDKLVEVPKNNQGVVKDFLSLQKSLDNILKAQLSPKTTDEKLSDLRKTLNKNYDNFIKKHGYLNAPKNIKILAEDPNYGKVAAVEKYKNVNKKVSAEKADIFFKRTASAITKVTSADNSKDALSLSLSTFGRVDMEYMKNLTGKSEKEIVDELGDLIFKNPETNLQELAEEYLSGNVREKLQFAKEAAKNNPEYKRNVEALKKIQPIDLTEKEISPHLGAPWINAQYYEDFIRHMIDEFDGKLIYDNVLGSWIIEGNSWNPKSLYTWGVADTKWNFIPLLEATMNKNTPVVTKDKKIDEVKTAEVKEKIEQIKSAFEKWIWTDDNRKADLIKTYNKIFNSEVLREYDGSHLTFDGLADSVKNKLYPHQKNIIWRMLQGKNTLIAHCVGAGKTFEMVVGAMEMKRIGLIRKPLFIVPANITKQFEREFLEAYPDANLLVLTSENLKAPKINVDFDEKLDTREQKKSTVTKSALKDSAGKETESQKIARLAERRKALSKIAVNDWDGIIISHDMFIRLPMSPQTYNKFYEEQIEILEHLKKQQYGNKAENKRHKKMISNAVENLKQKLNRDIKAEEKEIVIPFEELGVDQIFVDEADMFKNLGFQTRYSGRGNKVVGVSTSNAQRSLDMYVKTQHLTRQRNGGGVVFATGTPISNTLNEIYTMQRYLDSATLEDKNCKHFDGWAGTFCKEVDDTEVSPDGNGFRTVTRLNLTNLQSLIKMFKKFADIKMAEDLPHLVRPKLKNDDYTRVQIEPTEAFKDFKKEILARAEKVHNGTVKPDEDNFLKIVSDYRKASLDMRLIDPSLSEAEAGGKIDTICDTVFAKYKETANIKGAQLIFSDLSTPKGKKDDENEFAEEDNLSEETSQDEISVYERIKKGLVKRGIPANQIAFVHDAKNPNQRQNLFDRVNEGDIRVIIGSTQKMGAGTNFQKHLVALHHVDCPWRPRDIEQREGRILRNGNLNEEVEIFTYVTKGSFDANMWEKVAKKASMIDSLMRGDTSINELEDISKASADYQEIASTAYDNPLMSEQAKISSQIRRLKFAQLTFFQQMNDTKKRLRQFENDISNTALRIKNLKADINEKSDTSGDKFYMKLGEKTFSKRAEASSALDSFLHDFKNLSPAKIGEIGGFDITARAEFSQAQRGGVMEIVSKRIILQLNKHGSYSVSNSIKSMEYFINEGISKNLAENERKLQEYSKSVSELKIQLDKKFDKQSELDSAEKRLAEIQLQLSNNKTNLKSVEETQSQEKSETENSFDENKEITQENSSIHKETFAELSGYRGLTRKQDKNGKNIYYFGGKRISEDEAFKIFREQFNEKNDVLIDELKNSTGFNISLNKSSERPSLSFGTKSIDGGVWWTHLKFDNLKEAVATARHIFKNYADFIADSDRESFIAVYDDDGKNFSINRNGEEKFYSDKDKKIPETSAQDKFELGEFIHTKTAEKIPSAKLNEKVERDEYLKLNSLAKKHGGSYNTFAKRFLFDTAENRDKFIQESTQKKTAEEKSSKIPSKVWKIIEGKIFASGRTQYYEITDYPDKNYTVSKADAEKQIAQGIAVWSKDATDDLKLKILKIAVKQLYRKRIDHFDLDAVKKKYSTAQIENAKKIFEQLDADEISPQKANEEMKKILGEGAEQRLKKINDFLDEALKNNGGIKFSADFSVDNDEFLNHNANNPALNALVVKTLYARYIGEKKQKEFERSIKLDVVKAKRAGENVIRDELPTIKKLLELFNTTKDKPAQVRNREMYATEIEYVRRYFENEFGGENDNGGIVRRSYENGGDNIGNGRRENPLNGRSERNDVGGSQSIAQNLQGDRALIADGEKDDSKIVWDEMFETEKAHQIKIRKVKHSGEGAFFSGKIKNFVDEKDLTQNQKDIAEFGREMGIPVVFFRGDKKLNGAYYNGVTYINADSKITPEWIFSHESYHWLKNNNPELHREILKNVEITDEQRQIKRDERPDLEMNSEIDEEIIADAFEDTLKRAEILQQIGKKNKSLLEKIVSWLKTALDKLTRFFSAKARKNFEDQKLKRANQEKYTEKFSEKGLTREQKNKMYQTFANEISKLTDENRNKIFRVNKKSFEIQRANGEKLSAVDFKIPIVVEKYSISAKNSVDNENNLSDNDSEISQRFFGKYLGNGIMNMVRQTVESEISEHVDLSKMNDPVERDKARDSLPYIKQMLEHYNILR